MKRNANRLLGFLFASVMLLSVLIGAVAMQQRVFAADSENPGKKLKSVTLSDIQVPAVWENLDGTWSVASNAAYEKYMTTPKIRWTKQADPYAVSCAEGEMVKAGTTYYATVELISKDDRPFDGDNPITVNVNTRHGSDPVYHKVVGTKYKLMKDNMVMEVTVTFRACYVYEQLFELANAPGVTHGMPKVGEKAWGGEDVSPNPYSSDPAEAEVLDTVQLFWYKKGTTTYLSPQDTFQKGQEYELDIFLTDGYTAIIKPGTVIAYYDDTTGLYFDGEIDGNCHARMNGSFAPLNPVVEEVSLIHFTEPLEGDTVKAHSKAWADTSMGGAEYEVTGQTWHNQSGNTLPDSFTFEGAASYYSDIIVSPKNGFKFDSNTKVTLKNSFGNEISVKSVKLQSDGTLLVRTTTFDVIGGVDNVCLGYPQPTVGETAASCYPLIGSSAPFEFVQCEWHSIVNKVDKAMSESDVFEAGKEYYLAFTIKAKSGYSLSSSTKVTMIASYTGDIVETNPPSYLPSGILICSTKPDKAKYQAATELTISLNKYNGIVVNGYHDPVALENAAETAEMLSVPEGDGYEISFVRWVDEDFNALGKQVRLKPGVKYGLYVELAPKDGYYFAITPNINRLDLFEAYSGERVTNTKVLWEGAMNRAYGYIPGTGNLFFYTEPTAAARLINSVEFSLDEPTVGVVPDYTPTYAAGAHYHSANDIYESDPEYNTEYWNDVSWDFMTYGDKIAQNGRHDVHMQITADEGYAFPQDPRDVSVVVNGLPIWRYPNYTPENITTPAPNKLDIWLTFDIGLKYEVAFASLDHGLSPSTQMLSLNQTAVKPEDPSAEGWKFEGWYTDEALTKPYSFTAPVKGDIVLFAKWTERKGIPGDVDGSGAVDASDRMILARYLAGWEGYEAKIKDKAAADVDGNGKIEAPDRMILARYLAGWTGYDKYFK